MRFPQFLLFIMISGMAVTAEGSLRDMPPFRAPDCLGVNIHFAEPQDADLDLIEKAGFGTIRMDLIWQAVEREKGKYNFGAYQRLTEALRKRGITPLYILDYSNPLYEKRRSIVTEEGRKAFSAFAAAAVETLGQGILWEIWNEPNLEHFWEDQPSEDDYVQLVKASAEAMRAVDPECTILAPATSRIPMNFLKNCFEKGLLQYVDVVSVHPYRENYPETVLKEYAELERLIEQYASDKEIPIVSGEWGYAVHPYRGHAVDERRQAQYLARQFLVNFLGNARVSIWYDWKNDGTDPEEKEHNFGTVSHDLQMKEAYIAAKVLIETLRGFSFVKRLESEPNDYLLLFGDGEKKVLAAWTTGGKNHVKLSAVDFDAKATTMLGESLEIIKEEEMIVIPLTGDPIYLLGIANTGN